MVRDDADYVFHTNLFHRRLHIDHFKYNYTLYLDIKICKYLHQSIRTLISVHPKLFLYTFNKHMSVMNGT